LSVGIHRVWKGSDDDLAGPACRTKAADVAGGTGDVSFKFSGPRRERARALCWILTEPMLVARAQGAPS